MPARESRLHEPAQRQLLQAQLPQRLAWLRERGERVAPECRDINTLHRLATDAAVLAEACRAMAADALAAHLDTLHAAIAPLLEHARLPDRAGAAQITELITGLDRGPLPAIEAHAVPASVRVPGPSHELGFPLRVPLPFLHWTRFAEVPYRRASAAAAAPAEDEAWLEAQAQERRDAEAPATFGPADAQVWFIRNLGAPVAAADADDDAEPDDRAQATQPASERGLVERIRDALANGSFALAFQPIMSLRGEAHEQFQALLRLPGGGAVPTFSAAVVVPAATRAGLIGAVDRWVLEHCIALIARRRGDTTTPRLFVSQSLASVSDPRQPHWWDPLESTCRHASLSIL